MNSSSAGLKWQASAFLIPTLHIGVRWKGCARGQCRATVVIPAVSLYGRP